MVRMPLKFAFMAAGMALLLAGMRGLMPAVWRTGWEELNPEAFLGLAWCYQLGIGFAIALWMSRVQSRSGQVMAVFLAEAMVGLTLLEMAVPIVWIPMQAVAVLLALGLIGVLVWMRQWRVFWLGLAELHAVLVVVAAWQRFGDS
jgi:hypothetical protein